MRVQGNLDEAMEAAGGVSSNIVQAFRAVLQDSSLDGAFVSAAITLPASTELRDDIPDLNPVLLYQVRFGLIHILLYLDCMPLHACHGTVHDKQPNLRPPFYGTKSGLSSMASHHTTIDCL